MSLSDRLLALSDSLGRMVGSHVHAELRDIAVEARRLERFADEIVGAAQDAERSKHGLRLVSEPIQALLERGLWVTLQGRLPADNRSNR